MSVIEPSRIECKKGRFLYHIPSNEALRKVCLALNLGARALGATELNMVGERALD